MAGQELRGGVHQDDEPVDFGVTCQIDPNWHPLGRWPGIALLKIALLVPVDCCVRPGSVPLGPDIYASLIGEMPWLGSLRRAFSTQIGVL